MSIEMAEGYVNMWD